MERSTAGHRPIMEDIDLSEAARALFEAPFGVLAHEFRAEGPPTFVYANQARRPGSPCECNADMETVLIVVTYTQFIQYASPQFCRPCFLSGCAGYYRWP